jgi:hypothetical protein
MFTTSSFGFILTYVVTIYESIHTINILCPIMKNHCIVIESDVIESDNPSIKEIQLYQPIVHRNRII